MVESGVQLPTALQSNNKKQREMEGITFEVKVYNRNYPTWVDGSPLITTIERNDKYLKIERENHYGELHSMQRDGDKVSYYIHGVEVTKTMWKEYIRIWKKNW